MHLDSRKKKENPSIFSKAIAVLSPNIGNILKYRNVHNFYFNGVLNSFSLCMTVGVVSVILSMICLFTMFLTKWLLLKHHPWLGKAKATSISMVSPSWTIIITFSIIVFVEYMAVSWFSPHRHWLHHQIHRAGLCSCLGSLCYCRRMTQCKAVRPGGKDRTFTRHLAILVIAVEMCDVSDFKWSTLFLIEFVLQGSISSFGPSMTYRFLYVWLCNMALKPSHCLEQCRHLLMAACLLVCRLLKPVHTAAHQACFSSFSS